MTNPPAPAEFFQYRDPFERGGRQILNMPGEPDCKWLVCAVTPRPFTNLPPNARVRLRIKLGEIVTAVVKSEFGISHHQVYDFGDHWELHFPPEQFNAWSGS